MNHIHEALPDCFLKFIFKCKQLQMLLTLILLIFLISLAFSTKALATDSQSSSHDAQKIWDNTCLTCHGDSGDVARNFLKVVDGKLQGPMHKDTFRTFLTNHYLSESKADAIYSMLLAQATEKSRFEQECGSCHQKPADLVRDKLALYNGILYSRELKTPTYGFLETHRELSKEDVRFFMKKLTFIGYQIYRPIKMD